ncbi:MAG: T9SS type A sorting domain-containing protein, partial [candidate division Zixibacteria bacterium]|nr:T9SS type A sorting domain-containing protein [candidate division Zixibacteria bacterium]
YGNTFNGINLCTNGWASFTDSTCVEFGNMPIPHPEPPNNMLAVFYDDMNLENGGAVYFYTNNSDTAIASYIDVPDWRQEGTFTFQVILVAPAKIYFQYLSLGPGRMDENSIGIEDEDGLIGLQVANDQIYAHDSLAISFYKHWLTANPENGIVQPDLTDTISVGFDAATLDEGDYTGTIDITGWDIYHQEDPLSIAVTMHVTTQTNAPGEEDLPLPVNYALHQNYPNPFNPTTTIKYDLPDAANVKIEIFNLLGQRVQTLVDRKHQAGRYSINWHADTQPSGIYFYRLKTEDKTISRKMLLLK